jgi:hypothetical protein
MRTVIYIVIVIIFAAGITGCKKKFINQVPIEQYNIDGSTDYRYLFKGAVEDERKKDNRLKPNEFKD